MTATEELGFAAVARWVAADDDGEAFVFRKFDRLAARNLLCLQARMLSLEERLGELDHVMFKSRAMSLQEARWDWEALVKQSANEDGPPEAKEQMRLLGELRTTIKEYHEALDLQHRISSLSRPNKRVVRAYRSWFNRSSTPRLGGLSSRFLNDESDLVAIKTPKDHDHLSELLRRHWPAARVESVDGESRVGRFQEGTISTVANLISIVAAVALLVGSITGFLFVRTSVAKALMIAGFTGLFAVSMGLITNAGRPEIFAATAAYAAVLVVFVSNLNPSDKSGTWDS